MIAVRHAHEKAVYGEPLAASATESAAVPAIARAVAGGSLATARGAGPRQAKLATASALRHSAPGGGGLGAPRRARACSVGIRVDLYTGCWAVLFF